VSLPAGIVTGLKEKLPPFELEVKLTTVELVTFTGLPPVSWDSIVIAEEVTPAAIVWAALMKPICI
jgi:hypothetical protein